jgi:hypothetical protein
MLPGSRLLHAEVADAVWGVLLIARILIAVSLGQVAQTLLCPRCGKKFASQWFAITGVFSWPKSVRTADCENMQKMATHKVDLAVGRA